MAKMTVRVPSFKKGFPKSLPVPPRLLAFAKWLQGIQHGTLGYFDVLGSEPLDDMFLDDAARTKVVAKKLGIFLFLPDGSRLALWDYGGAEPAVVYLGSEGEFANIAPTFEAFLLALAAGKTEVNDLDDEEASASRPALRKWLKQEGVVATKKKVKVPDFEAWFMGEEDDGETEAPAPLAGFTLADFTPTLYRLLGRTTDDPELRAFLSALGHWPLKRKKSEDLSLYVEAKRLGYCLMFDDAPEGATGKGQILFLESCFFYAQGKDGYRGFAHPMPCKITWKDTMKSLASRLGPAKNASKDKQTGRVYGERWEGKGKEYGNGKAYVAVGYAKTGKLEDVFLGLR